MSKNKSKPDDHDLTPLLDEIKACKICSQHLELGPRPILQIHESSPIVIIGQAPGKKVHLSGVPWDDASGDNLRSWLGVDQSTFYNPKKIALLPMGFCYPGKGRSGDLPPRPECAPKWHNLLIKNMSQIKLTILIGQYAQKYYLNSISSTLTQTVRNYHTYLPEIFVLPHPSPRNNIWKAKNPWFEKEVIPDLRKRISKVLHSE